MLWRQLQLPPRRQVSLPRPCLLSCLRSSRALSWRPFRLLCLLWAWYSLCPWLWRELQLPLPLQPLLRLWRQLQLPLPLQPLLRLWRQLQLPLPLQSLLRLWRQLQLPSLPAATDGELVAKQWLLLCRLFRQRKFARWKSGRPSGP